MSLNQKLSDQLKDWSDDNVRTTFLHAATSSPAPTRSTPVSRGRSAGLADRTIQALWQAGLPVRPRPWPWAQVLLVGEPNWRPAPDGLRTPGRSRAGHSVSGELPTDPARPRGALRDQPRAVAATRDFLTGNHEPAYHADRPRASRRAGGQHGRCSARGRRSYVSERSGGTS